MFSVWRKKSLWIIGLVMVSIVGLVTGCGGNKAAQPQEKSDKKVIGFSVSTLNNPFFVDLRDGAQAAAKEMGVELIVMDAQNDTSKQMSNIENLVQQKVSVLIVNPVDSKAIVPAIEAANKANIPVITVDRSAEGGKVVSAIASDNVAGGKMAAQLLIDKLGGKGKVVELEGIPGSSAANDRGKGFDDAMKAAAGISIVAKQPADFDRAKGMKVMENILQANPEIQAVFAQNDEMALGAVEAIKAVNRTNVLVVGFDATADAVTAVNSGDMLATVAQKPKDMGKISIETAIKIMNGEAVAASIPVPLELIVKK
ncbi:D-ribose-binding protein [Propionispora sp. 2/2-37]|uniref:ribose ABC transporter substrate-binding protein RbsB n=1 Tax=Propionispora sp. 2/2-37 TaxID=1677858 RepID=UPI0006BB8679|nr:ribose ABC transporter substrate-binding protein RbsB [Propionispora sp. 2/2-37]CUH95937.1 D-ribose-binding protein [Propionispora sp. 2/2-37]